MQFESAMLCFVLYHFIHPAAGNQHCYIWRNSTWVFQKTHLIRVRCKAYSWVSKLVIPFNQMNQMYLLEPGWRRCLENSYVEMVGREQVTVLCCMHVQWRMKLLWAWGQLSEWCRYWERCLCCCGCCGLWEHPHSCWPGTLSPLLIGPGVSTCFVVPCLPRDGLLTIQFGCHNCSLHIGFCESEEMDGERPPFFDPTFVEPS
jgi:hypothetical protein